MLKPLLSLTLLYSTLASANAPAPLQIADIVRHPAQLAPDPQQRQLLSTERRIEHRLQQAGASFIKVHPHGTGARGGNQDMKITKGGLTPRYIWPWMRYTHGTTCPGRLLLIFLS